MSQRLRSQVCYYSCRDSLHSTPTDRDPGPCHLPTTPAHHHRVVKLSKDSQPVGLPHPSSCLSSPIEYCSERSSLVTPENHLWGTSSSTSSHCQLLFHPDLNSKTVSLEGVSLN